MTATAVTPKSPILIVSGMHRSGTSFVAGLLRSAGLFLGDRLLGADPTNPRGHFEDLDFLDYHRMLLRAYGFPDDGFVTGLRIEPAERFRKRAMALVEERRGVLRPWGWKDPRTALFLPFWDSVVPDARFLFVFRPPWDVVDSLFRRGDRIFLRNPAFTLAVWLDYNARIRDFARAHPERVLIRELSQVARNPEALCTDVREDLNIGLDSPQSTFQAGLLRSATAEHAAFLAAASAGCVELLAELRELAGSTGETPLPAARSGDAESLEPGMADWQQSRNPGRRSRAGHGPRVFIGVPVYQGEEFIVETLRSIQRQEHQDFEVCISIDGDDRGSAELCRPFLGDPRFELHVQPRRLGWAGNLNWLLSRCDGDFFCFWQQDDLAATSFLRLLVSHATHHPEATCVFSDVQWFGTRIDRVESPSLNGFSLDRVLQQVEAGHYTPFFGLVRADALASVGPIRLTPEESA